MKENERIKILRECLKLTQQQLADKIGVSKQYLSRVENGLTDLSKDKIILICRKFNISANWLLLDKGLMDVREIEERYKEIKNSVMALLDENMRTRLYTTCAKAVYKSIKHLYPNADIDDIMDASGSVFIREFSVRKIKDTPIELLIKDFKKRTKSSEFNEVALNEYRRVYVERFEKINSNAL